MGPSTYEPSSRAATASAAAGFAILLQLAALRAVLSTDGKTAAILGHPIVLRCAVLARFGKPCPACGATRGFVFALHGRWNAAWHLFPAAPLAVAGLGALACALLVLAWMQLRGLRRAAAGWAYAVRSASVAYAAAGAVVWLGAWIAEIAG
jgi:hypothetical protein